MLEGFYGKEAFDLRLTLLRMAGKLKLIIIITLLGTLVFGGMYYLKNVIFRGAPTYSARSTYRVDYSVEDVDVSLVVINEMTWNTYVHSEEFLDKVNEHLTEHVSYDRLCEMIRGYLDSDWRVPATEVTDQDPALVLQVASAVENVMTEEFPKSISEIDSIRVIDSAGEAKEVIPDVRPVRAFVLSGILTCFFTVIFFLLKELWDDSIWLPVSLERRYGLKVVGTKNSAFLKENISWLFHGKDKVMVCPLDEDTDPAAVAALMEQQCDSTEWIPLPAPELSPEYAALMRDADGILLAVPSGDHVGKKLERILEFLRTQDCDVTAAILVEEDERLLRWYYRLEGTSLRNRGFV